MKEHNTLRITTSAFVLLTSFLNFGCNRSLQSQSATATGALNTTDGLGDPTGQITLTVSRSSNTDSSPRVASVPLANAQNLAGLTLSVNRTGIPLSETYIFLSISRGTIHPESNDLDLAIATGSDPISFVNNHIGDLAAVRVRADLIDSPLEQNFSNFLPAPSLGGLQGVRHPGASFLARFEENDFAIPFTNSDPASLIDMSRLTRQIFNTLSNGISEALAGDSRVRLGGNDGAGQFRMYFVPHITHTQLSPPNRNVKGFGYIFSFSIDLFVGPVRVGKTDVHIPLSILFEPDTSLPGFYRVRMDPFSFTGATTPPDNLPRIVVYGNFAEEVRTRIVSALSQLPQNTLDDLETQLSLLGDALSLQLPSEREIPENFDVFLVPETLPLNATVLNQVMPTASGIPVKLLILE